LGERIQQFVDNVRPACEIVYIENIDKAVPMKTIIELKVFKNGGSNAIRIPASIKLEEPVLFLEIDDETEEMGLYRERPQKFKRLFELLDQYGPIPDTEWDVERVESDWPERESLKELEKHFE
jgi:antitoxin component of MazEF toxin-antitoxin module